MKGTSTQKADKKMVRTAAKIRALGVAPGDAFAMIKQSVAKLRMRPSERAMLLSAWKLAVEAAYDAKPALLLVTKHELCACGHCRHEHARGFEQCSTCKTCPRYTWKPLPAPACARGGA